MSNKVIGFIRFHYKRAFRTALVGTLGALEQIAITYILTEFLGLWYIASAIFGILVAFGSNYLLNFYWSFRDVINRERGTGAVEEFG